ncbi:MAG TPA: hypothetical protein VLA98_16005 [Solirubrobacteraceae bacterium]|nr:hypothetical protein [Solirubrobacteraceae bacterium]
MAGAGDQLMHMEMEVAHERFRTRIGVLVGVSLVVDVCCAVLAHLLERGAPHEFATVWDALFWTTTQMLTVSSQLPNPEHAATKALDVFLELYAVVVVTGLAATFTDLLHHRTRHRVRQRAATR